MRHCYYYSLHIASCYTHKNLAVVLSILLQVSFVILSNLTEIPLFESYELTFLIFFKDMKQNSKTSLSILKLLICLLK